MHTYLQWKMPLRNADSALETLSPTFLRLFQMLAKSMKTPGGKRPGNI
jgi:hypothetical protein